MSNYGTYFNTMYSYKIVGVALLAFRLSLVLPVVLPTLFSATGDNFSVIHVDYVDFVPEW